MTLLYIEAGSSWPSWPEDPDYWKGEKFAYVGSIQNLKDLKRPHGVFVLYAMYSQLRVVPFIMSPR